MDYNWQQKDWPNFKYDLQTVEELLFAFAEETGHVTGLLKAMPEEMQLEAIINTMVAEAIKTKGRPFEATLAFSSLAGSGQALGRRRWQLHSRPH